MKALITGTPGWLGTKLAKKLIEENFQVRCITLPGTDVNSLQNIGVEILTADITKKDSITNVCDNVSIVYHCAGIIHPKNIKQFYEVNYLGTKNLIDQAIKKSVHKFVYVSSNSAATGFGKGAEYKETDTATPYYHYGKSKLKAEQLLRKYYIENKIKTVIIRPNWLYGIDGPPRQTKFLNMVKQGKTLIFGNGKSYRSLCNIDNCVSALLLAGKSEKANGQTYFIADMDNYNIVDIYKYLSILFNIEYKPKFISIPMCGSVTYTIIDLVMQKVRFYKPELHLAWEWSKNIKCSIQKAKGEIGYYPLIGFFDGIKAAIEQL